MANTTLSLRDLLETLPQELYDEIYKATMAVLKEDSSPPLSKGFIVDKEFLPPKLIQINHQTRLEFGGIYYGKTKFTISCDKLGYKFLKSLDLVKQDSFPLRLVVTDCLESSRVITMRAYTSKIVALCRSLRRQNVSYKA